MMSNNKRYNDVSKQQSSRTTQGASRTQQSWKNNNSSDVNLDRPYKSTNSKQNVTHGKRHDPNLPLKKWVIENAQTMTLLSVKQFFAKNGNDEHKNFYVITQMIDKINNNIMNVLEELNNHKLISKRQNKEMNKYGYFHKAAYIKSGCNYEIYTRLVTLLYSSGFNPFTTNDRVDDDENHETALMGLFQVNNRLLEGTS